MFNFYYLQRAEDAVERLEDCVEMYGKLLKESEEVEEFLDHLEDRLEKYAQEDKVGKAVGMADRLVHILIADERRRGRERAGQRLESSRVVAEEPGRAGAAPARERRQSQRRRLCGEATASRRVEDAPRRMEPHCPGDLYLY